MGTEMAQPKLNDSRSSISSSFGFRWSNYLLQIYLSNQSSEIGSKKLVRFSTTGLDDNLFALNYYLVLFITISRKLLFTFWGFLGNLSLLPSTANSWIRTEDCADLNSLLFKHKELEQIMFFPPSILEYAIKLWNCILIIFKSRNIIIFPFLSMIRKIERKKKIWKREAESN